jgi:membrane protease subunit HflK
MSIRMNEVLRGIGPPDFRIWAMPVVLILLGIALLTTTIFTVGADEEAVLRRFGKHVRTTGPGIHLKLPFGIERATRVKVQRVFKEEFGFRTARAGVRTQYVEGDFTEESLMLTGDLNIAEVEWVVQYEVNDPAKFVFNMRDVVGTLRAASEAAMRRVVGDRSVTEVLTIGRSEIAADAERLLQSLLDAYGSGIKVVTVQLQDVNPPDPVKPSFNDVNQAKQEKERITNQARESYNKAVPEAEGHAKRMVTESEGYALSRVNSARGEAQRFLAMWEAYRSAKDITRRRLYLETMSELMPQIKNKVIIDSRHSGVLPLLNLDRQDHLDPAAQGGGK